MVAEIGQFALILALSLALAQSIVPLIGTHLGDLKLMNFGSSAAIGQMLFLIVAFAALVASYVMSDFSVLNVAENSNSAMPMIYKVTATWGNHEGSMLLWVLILALFGGAVAIFGDNLPVSLKARALAVQLGELARRDRHEVARVRLAHLPVEGASAALPLVAEHFAVREREPPRGDLHLDLGRLLDVRLVVAGKDVARVFVLKLRPDLTRPVGHVLVGLQEIQSAARRRAVRHADRRRGAIDRHAHAEHLAVVDVRRGLPSVRLRGLLRAG